MRVEIAVTKPVPTGVAPTETTGDPSNDHLMANSGRTILFARNDGTASHDVTIQAPGNVGGGLDVPDEVVSVAAGETKAIGPLDPAIMNRSADPDAGKVYVDVASSDIVFFAVKL